MEDNSRLAMTLSAYNKLATDLENDYHENKRNESELELVVKFTDLCTILTGTFGIDNHSISSLTANGNKITVKLDRL